MATYDVKVTFESRTLPPDTWRGEIVAERLHTCVVRAVKEASKAKRGPLATGKRWASVVVVVERSEAEDDDGRTGTVDTGTDSEGPL